MRDNPRLFDRQTRALFFEQQKNNEGEPIEMTLGWHVGSIDNVPHFFKEGGGGGFNCEMRIYPASGIASVVIANNMSFDGHGFLDTVDKEFR
jgi:D-alanyl-D-alanine carboxypeptidase